MPASYLSRSSRVFAPAAPLIPVLANVARRQTIGLIELF